MLVAAALLSTLSRLPLRDTCLRKQPRGLNTDAGTPAFPVRYFHQIHVDSLAFPQMSAQRLRSVAAKVVCENLVQKFVSLERHPAGLQRGVSSVCVFRHVYWTFRTAPESAKPIFRKIYLCRMRFYEQFAEVLYHVTLYCSQTNLMEHTRVERCTEETQTTPKTSEKNLSIPKKNSHIQEVTYQGCTGHVLSKSEATCVTHDDAECTKKKAWKQRKIVFSRKSGNPGS